MSFEAMLAWLGLKKWAVIGGLIGALASLKLFPGLTFWQGLTTVCFGWAAASFLTPLVSDWLSLTEAHHGGAGFLIGLLALSIVHQVVKALPEWLASAREALAKRAGG